MKEPKKLEWSQPQKVEYCIPIWLRDQQIKIAIGKVKGRIQGVKQTRSDPIAIVCFGPTLNDTWEKVRDYQHVISCSGSHKFLLERGITPTWHVEVDPRAHKIELLGPPHPDVIYLPASTCHPAYLDHLEKGLGPEKFLSQVLLWHVFDNAEEGKRMLPQGEWALTGGSNVGLRAMTIARFFGFTTQHVFGMDGAVGESGMHAAAHPNQPKGTSTVEYGGVTYRLTPAMLESARQTWHELNMMPDVKATFFGEGLVQAMARDYKREKQPGGTVIAMSKPELISAAYCDLNKQLHRENLAYGVGGAKHAETVLKLVATMDKPSVLDYGCGKGLLAKALPFPIWEYDPAVPEKAESPRPADLVVCTDVLEHVEPEKILFVLDDLRRCVKELGFFVIHTGPSSKSLPDGRNAHILQRPAAWWGKILTKFFTVGKVIEKAPLLFIVVAPLSGEKQKMAPLSTIESKLEEAG